MNKGFKLAIIGLFLATTINTSTMDKRNDEKADFNVVETSFYINQSNVYTLPKLKKTDIPIDSLILVFIEKENDEIVD